MSTPNAQHQVSPPSSPQQQALSFAAIESIPRVNTHPVIVDQSLASSLRPHKPGALHLTPCTADQYLAPGHDSEDRYELVDGFLVSLPNMRDSDHDFIITYIAFLLTCLPETIREPVRVYSQVTYHLTAKKTGGSSRDTFRIPDIFLVLKSDHSYSSDVPDSPFKGQRATSWRKARMIFEVTSTNRDTDLTSKLEEYQQEKIPEYVIIDRQKDLPNSRPCVEVHTLDRRGTYKKKVYYGDQKVDCSYCSYFGLTASQMLDRKALYRLNEEYRDKQAQETKRADQQTKRADQQTKRADSQTKRADRAEKERDQERKSKEEERKRADRAEKERDQERKSKEEETKRADHAQAAHALERQHWVAYVKGDRNSPPPGLELDLTEARSQSLRSLPSHSKSPVSASHPKPSASARHPKSPASARHPKSPASASPKSPASASPKSPASPPYTVRKTTQSDVKSDKRRSKGKSKGKKT